MSINSSIGRQGIILPSAKIDSCHVYAFLSQFNALMILKKHGTPSILIRLASSKASEYTLIASANAVRTKDSSRLWYVVRVMIGSVKMGTFYLLS